MITLSTQMKEDGKVRFPYCFPAVPRCHDGEQNASAIFNSLLSGLAPCQLVPGTSCRALWGHGAGAKRQKGTTKKERAARTGDKQGNRDSIETDIQGNGLGAKWGKEVRSGRSTLHFVFSHCRLPCPSMHLPINYLAFHISNSCSYSSLLTFPLKVAFPWSNSLKLLFPPNPNLLPSLCSEAASWRRTFPSVPGVFSEWKHCTWSYEGRGK